MGRVAFVQPDIPQDVKWDPAKGPGIVAVLKRLTLEAAATGPDLILWPEAVTPWAVKGDPGTQRFVESLARQAQAPILLGSIGIIPRPPSRLSRSSGDSGEDWVNGAFVVAPDFGLQNAYYAKRKLVAFGEYVPFRPVLGWLRKFVPIGDDDFIPGIDAAPLLVNLHTGLEACGILICYEDTYPQLARHSVLAGADTLAVLSNNAWFGRGAAAYQHAAHSVLRAVETRRPVLRCGNAGWSGWIDEYGSIRFVFADAAGGVYFRGTRTAAIERDSRWIGRHSFYVEHGDWFVLVSAVLALFGYAAIKTSRARVEEAAEAA
jgi:apolipoprotein N-acyltransferase